MAIYTKTGDRGETSLWGGQRAPKDELRLDVIGLVDETQAAIGLCRSFCPDQKIGAALETCQDELYRLNAELALANEKTYQPIAAGDITKLEQAIDELEQQLVDSALPLNAFLRPGGEPIVTSLHLARTICRRTERRLVALHRRTAVRPELLQYSNRLSDYLFQLARWFAAQTSTT